MCSQKCGKALAGLCASTMICSSINGGIQNAGCQKSGIFTRKASRQNSGDRRENSPESVPLLGLPISFSRQSSRVFRWLNRSPQCPVPEIAGILLRSKWAAGKAVRAGLADGGSISESIRDRRATQPPAHFHRNPLGRGQLAVFPRCSLDPYDKDMGASLAP